MTNAASVRRLPAEQKYFGKPVRLQGVITYRDQAWGFFVLQDESGGIPLVAVASDLPLACGNRVEIEGFTVGAFGRMGVDRPTVRLLEKVSLPKARSVTISNLLAGRYDVCRVELAGVVCATEVVQGHALLHLHSGTNHLDVVVRDLSPADPSLPRLVGATVRVRGTSCMALLPNSHSVRPYLLVGNTNDVSVVEPAPAAPFDFPITPIRDVATTNSALRVKLFARIESASSNGMMNVVDDTGSIHVRPNREIGRAHV